MAKNDQQGRKSTHKSGNKGRRYNNNNGPRRNIYNFLISPEGQAKGGLSMGFDYLDDELSSEYDIDLAASLGSDDIYQDKTIKAKDVVYHKHVKDSERKIFFKVSPNYIQDRNNPSERFPAPIVTVLSFNGEAEETIKSFDYLYRESLAYWDSVKKDPNNKERLKAAEENAKKMEQEREAKREAAMRRREQEEREEKERVLRDIKENRERWSAASVKQQGAHGYLDKKDMNDIIRHIHIREDYTQDKEGNRLHNIIVPLLDQDARWINYQTIDQNGNKLFARSMPLEGVYNIVGKDDGKSPIHFAEGLATTWSGFKITEQGMTVFCLNSGNLSKVMEHFREKYPDREFITLSDNDCHKPHAGNAGQKAALECAQRFGALNAKPVFDPKGYQHLPEGSRPTDWDDFERQYGLEMAKAAFQPDDTYRNLSVWEAELEKLSLQGHKMAWTQARNLLGGDGVSMSAQMFVERYEDVVQAMPEYAFWTRLEDEIDEKTGDKIRHYDRNEGKPTLADVPMEVLFNLNQEQIERDMDPMSASFAVKHLLPFIEKNRGDLQSALKSLRERQQEKTQASDAEVSAPRGSENPLEGFNLAPVRSIDIEAVKREANPGNKGYVRRSIDKGKVLTFVADRKMLAKTRLEAYVDAIDKVTLEDGTTVIKGFKGINYEGKGYPLNVDFQLLLHRKTLWEAVGDGKNPVSEVSKAKGQRTRFLEEPDVIGIDYAQKRVPMSKVRFTEEAIQQIRDFSFAYKGFNPERMKLYDPMSINVRYQDYQPRHQRHVQGNEPA